MSLEGSRVLRRIVEWWVRSLWWRLHWEKADLEDLKVDWKA